LELFFLLPFPFIANFSFVCVCVCVCIIFILLDLVFYISFSNPSWSAFLTQLIWLLSPPTSFQWEGAGGERRGWKG
jgi:hypothetical protein